MRRSTADFHEAMLGGYIGEVPIDPKPIADAVHLAITGRRLPRGIVFYYGDHDAELDELFGYPDNRMDELEKAIG